MDSILEKSKDSSRGLLFGLLVNCIFPVGNDGNCPLNELRKNLTTGEKHEYVMTLTDEEIATILVQHKKCYEKRLADLKQG